MPDYDHVVAAASSSGYTFSQFAHDNPGCVTVLGVAFIALTGFCAYLIFKHVG